MIKKITGILFAAAVVLVIAATVMHRGEYSSLLFNGQETETDTEQAATTGNQTDNPTEAASTDEAAPDEIDETTAQESESTT